MKEYPSRSNLNCFFSFNEASAKGGALLKFRSWFVDNRKTEKAIIFLCYPWWGRTTVTSSKNLGPAFRRKDNLFGWASQDSNLNVTNYGFNSLWARADTSPIFLICQITLCIVNIRWQKIQDSNLYTELTVSWLATSCSTIMLNLLICGASGNQTHHSLIANQTRRSLGTCNPIFWRRGQDSNLRYLSVHMLSKHAP